MTQIDRRQDFYSYVLDFSAVAAGAVSSNSFSIDTDSNFSLSMMMQQSDLAGAAITVSTDIVPLCTIQITDGGSSRQLFSNPAPLAAVMGKGDNPFILPNVREFAAGSTVSVTLTNYSAATTYNVRLVFSGIKTYIFG